MATKGEQIVSEAIKILKNEIQGVRYSDLIRRVKDLLPDMHINTIHGNVWDLDKKMPNEVYRPERGLFRHVSFSGKKLNEEQQAPHKIIKEEEFYGAFADYLVGELEECTKAIPLGKNIFRDKWGTPDVIGKNESGRSDIIKRETEIISAEIKTDDRELITAFGQACAYKSFSHKVYIVIPESASEEDKSRIESLSLIFGIGLIFFNNTDKENPDFEIRVRPIKHEPDSFYTNKYLKLIEKDLFD